MLNDLIFPEKECEGSLFTLFKEAEAKVGTQK